VFLFAFTLLGLYALVATTGARSVDSNLAHPSQGGFQSAPTPTPNADLAIVGNTLPNPADVGSSVNYTTVTNDGTSVIRPSASLAPLIPSVSSTLIPWGNIGITAVSPAPTLAQGEVFAGKTRDGIVDNVPALQATFPRAVDIAFDKNSNIVIGDKDRLRLFNRQTNFVTTIPGLLLTGLQFIESVCADPQGNTYVLSDDLSAQPFPATIRKLDASSGSFSVLAQYHEATSGQTFGGDNGPISQAIFASIGFPSGLIQHDGQGHLYILDGGNYRIRKLDIGTGIVTTVAGNGSFTFNGDNQAGPSTAIRPGGFVIDGNGDLLIADNIEFGFVRIRKLNTSTGTIATLARVGPPPTGIEDQYRIALGRGVSILIYNGGPLLQVDVSNNQVVSLSNAECIAGRAGAFDGPISQASFRDLKTLITGSNGNMYALEAFNSDSVIRVIDSGNNVTTVVGIPTSFSEGQNALQVSLGGSGNGYYVDSMGSLYFSSGHDAKLLKIDSAQGIHTVIGSGCEALGPPNEPPSQLSSEVRFNSNTFAIAPSSDVYFEGFFDIRKFDARTGRVDKLIDYGSGQSLRGVVKGLTVDSGNYLYAAATFSGTTEGTNADIIERINLRTLAVEVVAGAVNKARGYSGDGGPATQAQFSFTGLGDTILRFDPDGNLIVSDSYNNRVRRVDLATGIVNTIAGTGVAGNAGDGGDATDAQFNLPHGICFDPAGNMYIGDSVNSSIRKIDRSTKKISTVAQVLTQPRQLIFLAAYLPLACDSQGNIFAPSFDHLDQILIFRQLGSLPANDLSISKTHSSDFTPGSNGAYTLTVKNGGTTNSSGTITVADALPNGLSFVSGSGAGWNCSASGQMITCMNNNSLPSGASSTITLTVRVANDADAGITNSATVTSSGDSIAANNIAYDFTVVKVSSDLALNTNGTPNPVAVNNNVTYTSTVTNSGPSPSQPIFVSTLPSFGASIVSGTASQGTCTANSNPGFQFTKIDLPPSRLPDRFPSDIPVEDSGNAVTQNYIGATNDGRYQATRQFATTRTLSDAISIYQNYFTVRGWVVNQQLKSR
jgi:uncharacterized repeat protein (TIGR01451 family)